MIARSVCLLLLASSAFCAISPTLNDYTHSLELLDSDRYTVFWKYDATTITFEVHAKTLGWVGFGLTPNGGMAGSDMTITWIKDGNTFFSDRHALGKYEPVKDASQDWNLLSAEESGQYTIIKLSRKHVTNDSNDLCITTGTMRLIYSFNANDPIDESGPLVKHTVKGTKSIQLLSPVKTTEPKVPSDAFSFDFINTGGKPSNSSDTTYWCQAFKPPQLNGTKHHVVMIEPIIQEGHESLVHHILLYACNFDLPPPYTPENADGFSDDCFRSEEQGMRALMACQSIFYAWAIGAEKLWFPEHVGMPLGDDKYPTLFRMETHYDNPEMVQGLKDNSGLRMWLSPTLRDNDAAILEVGMDVNENQLIPPKSDAYFSQGLCHGDCLKEAMTEANYPNIKLFGNFLHSHLAGFGLRVRHIRNGVELPIISEDNSYDFNFQEMRVFNEEVTVQGGDHLVTDCAYQTKSRTKLTEGGISTEDEMCLSYLLYYPKIPVTKCQSTPTAKQMAKFLAEQGIETECEYKPWRPELCFPVTKSGKNVYDVLHETSWDKTKTNLFQKLTTEGETVLVCESTHGQEFQTDKKQITFPEITQVYKDESIYSTCPSAFELFGSWSSGGTSKASATEVSFTVLIMTTFIVLQQSQV